MIADILRKYFGSIFGKLKKYNKNVNNFCIEARKKTLDFLTAHVNDRGRNSITSKDRAVYECTVSV